jgi:hypothetical protein
VFTGSRLSGFDEHLWVVRPDGTGQRPLGIAGALPDWIGARATRPMLGWVPPA